MPRFFRKIYICAKSYNGKFTFPCWLPMEHVAHVSSLTMLYSELQENRSPRSWRIWMGIKPRFSKAPDKQILIPKVHNISKDIDSTYSLTFYNLRAVYEPYGLYVCSADITQLFSYSALFSCLRNGLQVVLKLKMKAF